MRAKVVLILSAVLLVASSAYAGEGKCESDAQTCLNYLAQKVETKGWLGVEYKPNEEAGGYTVTKVVANSPAYAAGFQVGDIVVAMNGVSLGEESEELKAIMSDLKPGKSITYKVIRENNKKKLNATLADMPEDVALQLVGGHMLSHATMDHAKAEEE